MLALSLAFTACGNIDNPLENLGTQDTHVLAAALQEGALVTITYTVDGVTYTTTFKKVGDEYVEQSTTSAARAMTRMTSAEMLVSMNFIPEKNVLNFMAIQVSKVVLNLEINSNDGTYAQTFSDGAELNGMRINDYQAAVTPGYDKTVQIFKENSNVSLGVIGYSNSDTWGILYNRLSMNGHMIIQIINNRIFYSNGGVTGQLFADANCNNALDPSRVINNKVYIKVVTETYQEARWNESDNKYVYTPCTADAFTQVSSSGCSVDWPAGTYVVKSDIDIKGDINLKGDVNLILCDGATLLVNGSIDGNGHALTIYGQSGNSGNFVSKSQAMGFSFFKEFTIHGGNINVTSTFSCIRKTNIIVYGGKHSLTATESAIDTGQSDGRPNFMKVYGGEVEAISKMTAGIYVGDGENLNALTVFGGKVTAQGGDGYPAIRGDFEKGGGTSINFYESDDGVNWATPANGHSTDKRYFKAE